MLGPMISTITCSRSILQLVVPYEVNLVLYIFGIIIQLELSMNIDHDSFSWKVQIQKIKSGHVLYDYYFSRSRASSKGIY